MSRSTRSSRMPSPKPPLKLYSLRDAPSHTSSARTDTDLDPTYKHNNDVAIVIDNGIPSLPFASSATSSAISPDNLAHRHLADPRRLLPRPLPTCRLPATRLPLPRPQSPQDVHGVRVRCVRRPERARPGADAVRFERGVEFRPDGDLAGLLFYQAWGWRWAGRGTSVGYDRGGLQSWV